MAGTRKHSISNASCLNGAALKRARRFDGIRTTRLRRHLASTGPRSNERGDHPPMRPCGSGRYQASTGPRSNERGDRKEYVVEYSRDGASTGPRSNERGDKIHGRTKRRARSGLQRGRAQTSAEIRRPPLRRVNNPRSFNGAALKRARRSGGCRPGQGGPKRSFNGAALKRARRSTERGGTWCICGSRFNGAALKRARRLGMPRSWCSPGPYCFNGAALKRARR